MSAWSVCHHLTPGGSQVHYTENYTLLVLWSLTEGHDYACSCPRYADSDMDTHGASGNWSHVNRANFTAKSS